jgi:hypothetical protein
MSYQPEVLPDAAHQSPATEASSDQSEQEPDRFSRKQASLYLKTRWGLSYAVYTLALYAAKGTGPEYQRAGPRAVYRREALDSWAKTKLTAPGRKASELKPMAECGHERL